MTKLSSALPKGSANGLEALTSSLIKEPSKLYALVVVVDCKRLETDMDTGDVVPTARIQAIEPVSPMDRDLALRILGRARQERTGEAVLPLELEEAVRPILTDAHVERVDPETGEIISDSESGDK